MRDPSELKAAEPTALPWLLKVSRRFDLPDIVVASEVRGAAIAPAPWMVASLRRVDAELHGGIPRAAQPLAGRQLGPRVN